jgi:replicative DNA helicase
MMTSNPLIFRPSAIQAEQALLAAMLAGDATPADLPDFSADWFHDPIHAAIFRTIEAQIASGSPTDIGSLGSILGPCSETTGGIEPGCMLEEVGGAGYLAELAGRSPADAALSVREIRDTWLCRELIDLGESIVSVALEGNGPEALLTAMKRVADLAVATR